MHRLGGIVTLSLTNEDGPGGDPTTAEPAGTFPLKRPYEPWNPVVALWRLGRRYFAAPYAFARGRLPTRVAGLHHCVQVGPPDPDAAPDAKRGQKAAVDPVFQHSQRSHLGLPEAGVSTLGFYACRSRTMSAAHGR